MRHRDPIASLTPVPILVTLGGEDYEIPALPALDWLRILLQESYSTLDIVPGLFTEEVRVLVEDRMAIEEITWEEVAQAGLDAITAVSGRDYWFTVRLLTITRLSWDTVGAMVIQAGIDARTVSIAAWIDVAYHVAREIIASNKDGQQRLVRFVSELEAPPPGESQEIDEEFEAAAFEQAVRMSQH